jgi:uncharacterized protein (DUF952 family)
MIIFHITTRSDWEKARTAGSYQADTFAQEGFIHCSTHQQVLPVANRFYHGKQRLVLLAIDTEKLDALLIWENLEGGQENFPHIYGPVNLSAVLQAVNFEPDPNGSFNLPADLE